MLTVVECDLLAPFQWILTTGGKGDTDTGHCVQDPIPLSEESDPMVS